MGALVKRIKTFSPMLFFVCGFLSTQVKAEVSMTYLEWKSSGHFVDLPLNGSSFRIFYRTEISSSVKPWLTLTHGFPTNSYDFHRVFQDLSKDFNVLTLDFLGFGASAKPRRHQYSLFEQANILEALWKKLGIKNTFLFAHDLLSLSAPPK